MYRLRTLASLALGALLFTSCTADWSSAPTYVAIEDFDSSLEAQMRAAVGPFGYQPLTDEEKAAMAIDTDDYGFRLSGLKTTQSLSDAMGAINSVFTQRNSSTKLSRAVMVYEPPKSNN